MEGLLNSLRIELYEAGARPWGRLWRNRDYYDKVSRLWLVESGSAWVRHHGRDYRLRSGWLYLVPAYTRMSFCCKRRFVPHWVHFNATLFGGPEFFACVACQYAVKLADPEHTLQDFGRLESIVSRTEPALRMEAIAIVLQLMAPFIVAADLEQPSERALATFRETLAYVDDHLHEPITAADMAAAAHLERSYFSRLFSKLMGMAPSHYLQRRRIQKAGEALMNERIKFSVLARRTGFADASHFSRVFKKVVGVSPREFRRKPRLMP